MKKRGIVWLLAVCIMVLFCGCGKISNDKLTIQKYKGLKIEEQAEASDEEASDVESSDSDLEKRLWDAVVQNSEVKEYPKDLVEEYTEELKSQYSSYAKMYGITPEEAVEKEYGVSIEQVAKNMACKELAVELIAEKEHLEISDKDYKENLKVFATKYGFDDPNEFEKFVGKEKIKEAMLRETVTEFLIEHSK